MGIPNQKSETNGQTRRAFLANMGKFAAVSLLYLYSYPALDLAFGKTRLRGQDDIPLREIFGEGEEGERLYYEVMALGESGIRFRNEKECLKRLGPPCAWLLENMLYFPGFKKPPFDAKLSPEDRESQHLLAAYKYLLDREATELCIRGLPFLVSADHIRFLRYNCYTAEHLREFKKRRPEYLDNSIKQVVKEAFRPPFLDSYDPLANDGREIYTIVKIALMDDLAIKELYDYFRPTSPKKESTYKLRSKSMMTMPSTDFYRPEVYEIPVVLDQPKRESENNYIFPSFIADAICDQILDRFEKNKLVSSETIAFFRVRKELLQCGCPVIGPHFEELKKFVLKKEEELGIKRVPTIFPNTLYQNRNARGPVINTAKNVIPFSG